MPSCSIICAISWKRSGANLATAHVTTRLEVGRGLRSDPDVRSSRPRHLTLSLRDGLLRPFADSFTHVAQGLLPIPPSTGALFGGRCLCFADASAGSRILRHNRLGRSI